MTLAIIATVAGLAILAWSADKFVLGASAVARHLGIAPLLIGMLVIGFGTSAPEMVVSAFAAAGGNPELALGNAFGSNLANIGLILGVTAIVLPVAVHRGIVRKELPVLLVVTALTWVLLLDQRLSFVDALILLGVLGLLVTWAIVWGPRVEADPKELGVSDANLPPPVSQRASWIWLVVGLVLLVASSRLLVWGAVGIAERLGWPDLVIGLTVVALGTSAPELASALVAALKGENELVLGNVIGSNLFNTLGVIGVAGVIAPATVSPEALTRDLPVITAFTIAIVVFGLGRFAQGKITRWEGALFVLGFVAYTAYLLITGI